MGMYSNVTDHDVKIINLSGLEEYLEKQADDSIRDALEIEKQGEEYYLNFDGMDGWKIISYWYSSFCEALRDLAVFVEGYVYLTFENDDESGWFEFKDGKCIVHTGQTVWQRTPVEKMNEKELPKMSRKVRGHLVARRL